MYNFYQSGGPCKSKDAANTSNWVDKPDLNCSLSFSMLIVVVAASIALRNISPENA